MEMVKEFLLLFENDGLVAFATLAISIIALSLSIVSLISSRGANKKLIEIETARDERLELQEKKAKLTISHIQEIDPGTTKNKSFLEITNTGDTEARDIEIIFDGNPAKDHSFFKRRGSDASIAVLGPKTSKKISLRITLRASRPKEVGLHWKNSDGSEDTYVTSY